MMLPSCAIVMYISIYQTLPRLANELQNESVTSLLYPHDPEIHKTDLGPKGATRSWVTANTIKPRPQWLSESEVTFHNQIFAEGGYQGPLNWYAPIPMLHDHD